MRVDESVIQWVGHLGQHVAVCQQRFSTRIEQGIL